MRKLLFYITFLTLSGQAQEINFEQNWIVARIRYFADFVS
jgi:hypothetical protein